MKKILKNIFDFTNCLDGCDCITTVSQILVNDLARSWQEQGYIPVAKIFWDFSKIFQDHYSDACNDFDKIIHSNVDGGDYDYMIITQ